MVTYLRDRPFYPSCVSSTPGVGAMRPFHESCSCRHKDRQKGGNPSSPDPWTVGDLEVYCGQCAHYKLHLKLGFLPVKNHKLLIATADAAYRAGVDPVELLNIVFAGEDDPDGMDVYIERIHSLMTQQICSSSVRRQVLIRTISTLASGGVKFIIGIIVGIFLMHSYTDTFVVID